jgi:spermidine/putrescine transport system substrate-binding protein
MHHPTRPTPLSDVPVQKLRRPLVLLAAGALAVTALVSSPLAPRVAAQEDCELGGELNFIGWAGEDAATVARPFFEEHGIVVNPTYVGNADEPLTLFNTGGRGQMDIIAYNKDFGNSILDVGAELFAPLDMSRIPNAEGLFPALKNAEWATRDGVVYGIPLVWGDEPLVYDPSKWSAEDLPSKYTGFSDPKFAGELTMVDDAVANTWLWARSLGHEEPARLTQEQLDEVINVMLETKPNIVTFAPGLGEQADVLIRGDASMAIGGWAFQVQLAREKGVELAIGLPEEDGTYFWADAYAIAVDSPNACNAYAFIDYMMEPENNAAIAMELGSGATIVDAVEFLDEESRALYDYSIPEDPESVLGTQVVFPPAEDDGDIVGIQAWVEAWEDFKLR